MRRLISEEYQCWAAVGAEAEDVHRRERCQGDECRFQEYLYPVRAVEG